jgi:hypothetical protein
MDDISDCPNSFDTEARARAPPDELYQVVMTRQWHGGFDNVNNDSGRAS